MASCLPYASTVFPGNRKSRMSPPALRLLIVQRSKRPEHKTTFSAQRFVAWCHVGAANRPAFWKFDVEQVTPGTRYV
ncbi:hypothetical protein [Paraburkholderia terrae]